MSSKLKTLKKANPILAKMIEEHPEWENLQDQSILDGNPHLAELNAQLFRSPFGAGEKAQLGVLWDSSPKRLGVWSCREGKWPESQPMPNHLLRGRSGFQRDVEFGDIIDHISPAWTHATKGELIKFMDKIREDRDKIRANEKIGIREDLIETMDEMYCKSESGVIQDGKGFSYPGSKGRPDDPVASNIREMAEEKGVLPEFLDCFDALKDAHYTTGLIEAKLRGALDKMDPKRSLLMMSSHARKKADALEEAAV